jgi:hypothetical protein
MVTLWVTGGNLPAQSLYRALGFVETGDYQPLPSDPSRQETRMRLSLSGGAGQEGAPVASNRVRRADQPN